MLDDPVITAIAERLGRSPAQVVLRWHIQRGRIVFPKSVTLGRIAENFDLFGFELDADDIERIDAPRPRPSRPHRTEPRHLRRIP